MRTSLRTDLTYAATLWMVFLLIWAIWAQFTQRLTPGDVPAVSWERAAQGTVRLPLSWVSGRTPPPLLPVQGEIIMRSR